jgi:fructokinase
VIKVSDEEMRFLSDAHSLEAAARGLWHDRLRLVAVTEGEQGCTYFTPDSHGHLPGFPIRARDTTGAGDAFVAGMLSGLLAADDAWDTENIERALTLGNAVAALSTTRIGAMAALPSRPRVHRFIRSAGHGLRVAQ